VASPCTADATLASRSGLLAGLTPRADHPLDAPVTVGPSGPTLRVTGFDVIGAGQDGALPPDRYRVVVHVAPTTHVTWTLLDPRLVLQSGVEALPSAPITVAPGTPSVDVAYLVPAWQRPFDVAWYVTDPATQAQVRWRATLDAPSSRPDVLRDALDIQISGHRDTEPTSATLLLSLRNTSTTTLVVTNADVVVKQQDRALPVAAFGRDGVALKPGAARTLLLPLRGIDRMQPLTVSVGGSRFRIRF
jgi:hypothetical protein